MNEMKSLTLNGTKYDSFPDQNAEKVANKVTAVDENATDDQYPSAKAVYDAISGIETGTGDCGCPTFEKVGGEGAAEYNEIAKATEVSTFEELLAFDGNAILRDYRHENTTAVANTSYDILKIPVQAGDVIRDMLGSYRKKPSNTSAWMYAFYYDENNSIIGQNRVYYDGYTGTAQSYDIHYLDLRENGLTVPENTSFVLLNLFNGYERLVNGSYVSTFALPECDIVTVNQSAELTTYDGTTELAAYVPQEGTSEVYYEATDDVRIPRYEEALGSETKTGSGTITGTGEPTTTTEGEVGQLYMDTSTSVYYKCVSAEDGVYTWELFIGKGHYEHGKNLFNTATITEGYTCVESTVGSLPTFTAHAEFAYSELIPVQEGNTYIFSADAMGSAQVFRLCCCDKNGYLVATGIEIDKTSVDSSRIFTIPTGVGCTHIRISAKIIYMDADSNAQLELGSTRTEFEAYTESFVPDVPFDGIEKYEPLVNMIDEKINAYAPAMASEAKAGVAKIWTTDNGDGTFDLHIDTTGEVD